ncbi:hypothetical protein BJ508DRAFT_335353 [Ascobolus immersus RN42]|uniref:Uncharacterized protein n=1 Tax=Ascobolus immersus RN42 TaxID=1160509 RepID=A0A3N4HIS2_ASCIM|nr:hypothetical protein BJ508DRAFT_335353 [Ascobolus immersus RN42]
MATGSKRGRTQSVAPGDTQKRTRLSTQTSMGPPVSPGQTPNGSQTQPVSSKSQKHTGEEEQEEESTTPQPEEPQPIEQPEEGSPEEVKTRIRLVNTDGSSYLVPRRIFDITQATTGKEDFGGRARVVISLIFFAQRAFSSQHRHDLIRAMVPSSLLLGDKAMDSFVNHDVRRKIERTQTKLKDSIEQYVAAVRRSDIGVHLKEQAEKIAKTEGRYNHPDERLQMPETVADLLEFQGLQGIPWTKGDVVQCLKRILLNAKQPQIPDGFVDWFFGDKDNFWLENNSIFLLSCVLAIYRHEGPLGKDMNETVIKTCYDVNTFRIPDNIHWPEPHPRYQTETYDKAGNDTRALKNIKVYMGDNMGNNLHKYVDGALVLAENVMDISEEMDLDYDDEDDAGDGSASRPFRSITVQEDEEEEASDTDYDNSFQQDEANGWYDKVEASRGSTNNITLDEIEEIREQVKQSHKNDDAAMMAKIAKDGLIAAHARSSAASRTFTVPPVVPPSLSNPGLTPFEHAWLMGDALEKIRLMNRFVQQDAEVARLEMLRCYFKRKNIEHENLELQKEYLTLMKLRATLKKVKSKVSEDVAAQKALKKFVETEKASQAISEEDLRMFEENFGFVRPMENIDFDDSALFDKTNLDKMCEDLARYDGVPKDLPPPTQPPRGNMGKPASNHRSFGAALERNDKRGGGGTKPRPLNLNNHRGGSTAGGLFGQSTPGRNSHGTFTPRRQHSLAPRTGTDTPKKAEAYSPSNPVFPSNPAFEVIEPSSPINTNVDEPANDHDSRRGSLGSPFRAKLEEERATAIEKGTQRNSFGYDPSSSSIEAPGNKIEWDSPSQNLE